MDEITNRPKNQKELDEYIVYTPQEKIDYCSKKINSIWNDNKLTRKDIDYIVYKLGSRL